MLCGGLLCRGRSHRRSCAPCCPVLAREGAEKRGQRSSNLRRSLALKTPLQGGDETKFDEFLGNDGGVLAKGGVYDEEDREADAAWDAVDEYMDGRRKVGAGAAVGGAGAESGRAAVPLQGRLPASPPQPARLEASTPNASAPNRPFTLLLLPPPPPPPCPPAVQDQREAKAAEELERFRAENPKISEQFADLKRKLSELAAVDWESIPEIGDYTIKKTKRVQTFTPVPDSLLARAAANNDTATALDAKALAAGLDTPLGGTVTDLTAMGAGRNTVVRLKLDKISDSVSGQTVVDPKVRGGGRGPVVCRGAACLGCSGPAAPRAGALKSLPFRSS